MSGLVNKVKEALHSAQDTPTGERSGKLNLTPEERERLEAAGYGPEHHAEKRHLGATEDITQAPGGHPPSYYLNQDTQASSNLPGSFPESDQDTVGSRQHKDGREYSAPAGTHLGQSTLAQQQISDPSLTNPTAQGGVSNITQQPGSIGTDSRATDATTGVTSGSEAVTAAGVGAGAGAGAGAIAAHETKPGPNKLHKKGDPRGHVAFDNPPSHEAVQGTSTTETEPTRSTAVHHHIAGTHHTPTTTQQSGDIYDQQASRKYDANAIDPSSTDTPNFSYPTSAIAASTGATTLPPGTVTGGNSAGSTQLADRTVHDEKSTIDNNPATSSAGGHRHVSGTVYNTVTGAGSQDDPTTHTSTGTINPHQHQDQTFSSHPGLTSGTSAVPREAGDATIASGYGNSGSGTNTNTSNINPGTTANTATSSSNAPLPTTLTSASGLNQDPTASSTAQPTATTTTTTGAGAGARGLTGAGAGGLTAANQHSGSNTSTGTGTGTGTSPGHVGSRVVHTCSSCGADNDITHYFNKDTVYRLSQ